jgi:hypothetical protein
MAEIESLIIAIVLILVVIVTLTMFRMIMLGTPEIFKRIYYAIPRINLVRNEK